MWDLVCDFLEPKQSSLLKLTCVAAGLSELPLAEQLLLMTKVTVALRLREIEALRVAEGRILCLRHSLDRALHRQNMRIAREIEERGEPDPDDEDHTCQTCGRVWDGFGNFYYLVRIEQMCQRCYRAEYPRPEVERHI